MLSNVVTRSESAPAKELQNRRFLEKCDQSRNVASPGRCQLSGSVVVGLILAQSIHKTIDVYSYIVLHLIFSLYHIIILHGLRCFQSFRVSDFSVFLISKWVASISRCAAPPGIGTSCSKQAKRTCSTCHSSGKAKEVEVKLVQVVRVKK